MNIARTALLSAFALATGSATAATVLEYDTTGTCATEFDRMRFDGLYARIDQTMQDTRMSTIFDDGEQLMHMLMHDSRNVMTMESDDDAIEFQSDVGKSTLFFAANQTRALTGMDTNQLMEQARATQAAACPELAQMGFADPDYADAAARCAQTMQSAAADGGANRADSIGALIAQGGRERDAAGRAAPPPAAGTAWSTTRVERDGRSETIAGIDCEVKTTRRGDTVLLEECVARLDTLGLDPSPMRRIERIVSIGEGMSAGVSEVYPDMDPERDQPASLPLRRTCYADGKQTGTATLRIRRDVELAADVFDIPKGYTPFDAELPDTHGIDSMDVDALLQQRR
ncbi:hypothetical protein [Chiayiivirga flava]|uniref:DUF4412 domain-containing protein n=1 Tax=Chiayiivirga flava TaxID=659595 RepID=A0A7W8D820_9GAMM|nr:hypothetical protein [Chiayiivirga flava]MBB5208457.1 hypothetical protein [Chiayiivirga flava]